MGSKRAPGWACPDPKCDGYYRLCGGANCDWHDRQVSEKAARVPGLQAEVDRLLGIIRSRNADLDALRSENESLLLDKLLHHPRPWTIEPDWCVEIHDASGDKVMSCMTRETAESIIASADRLAATQGGDDG